jgi:hypothetical protein
MMEVSRSSNTKYILHQVGNVLSEQQHTLFCEGRRLAGSEMPIRGLFWTQTSGNDEVWRELTRIGVNWRNIRV